MKRPNRAFRRLLQRTFRRSEPRTNRRRPIARFLLLSLLCIGSVSGCVLQPSIIESRINEVLLEQEPQRTTVVDLGQIVPGEWTQLTIICNGSTPDQVQTALGVEWPEMPDVDSANFWGLMVFSSEHGVEHYFSFGEEHLLRDPYFVTCGGSSWVASDWTPPVVLNRSQSALKFELDDERYEYSFWYLPADEIRKLRTLDN